MSYREGEVLYFNKPFGLTSFQVVDKVRWIITQAYKVKKIKVGHAGTLDPLASGVLILCTERATARIEEFQSREKEYVAGLRFGATTPSFDLETQIDNVYLTEHITPESVREALKKFIGVIEQVPPVFSACKVNGKRAYKLARKGETPELKPKKVIINNIELLECNLPTVKIKIVCGKGTYIRSLARDIGVALNSGAHLTGLVRTRIGEVRLEDCMEIDDFEKILNTNKII